MRKPEENTLGGKSWAFSTETGSLVFYHVCHMHLYLKISYGDVHEEKNLMSTNDVCECVIWCQDWIRVVVYVYVKL